MEKRRRARINASLTELKSLLLEAIKKEGARQNKMEKADILEMAVKHLRHIQRQQFTGESLGELQLSGESSDDSSELNKYQLGFHACVQEVCKYLDWNRDEDVELKTKLLNHLANCMTSADCQTISTAPLSSSLVSSPSSSSSSSYVIHIPVSTQSGAQASPSSFEMPSTSLVESSSVLSMSSQSNEISQTDAATREIKPKLHVRNPCSDAVLQRAVQGTTEGILHTVLTSSSTNSVLVKPNMLSLPVSGNLLDARRPEDGRPSSNSHISSSSGHISSTSSGTHQGGSVTEINNNSIILPALVNMTAPTTFTCVQQPNQQTQFYQHQHQTQLQHQLFSALPDGSSFFTSSNPLQLIPTKTANGEIAFLLSTTNLVSSSPLPGFSIPVITQPTVSHSQILAPPISQPAIQFAMSYPPEDQNQPVTFITKSIQPINSGTSFIHSSIPNIVGQTTPLNLSSTTQQGQQATHQLMPKQNVALPKPDSEHCDDNLPRRAYTSSPAVRQTGLSEAGRYNCPPYITKPPQVEHSQLSHPIPSTSWQTAPRADPTSLIFTRQATSFKPDAQALATSTDPGKPVFNRSEIRLATDTDPGRSVYNRSEIRLATDTDPGRSVYNRSENRIATDTDAERSVYNRSENIIATDTDPGRSVYNRSENRLATDTDPGRSVYNRSENIIATDTDAERSVYNRSENRIATDTDQERSGYNRSEIRLGVRQPQLGTSSSQSSEGSNYILSTHGHFFRPWRE